MIYPAGNSVILYNSETKLQRFLPISEESESILCLGLSPNKRYLGVGERTKKGFTVAVWDLVKIIKKKNVPLHDVHGDSLISIAFSVDSKILLLQSGKPDWSLTLWNWEKAKMVMLYHTYTYEKICIKKHFLLRID